MCSATGFLQWRWGRKSTKKFRKWAWGQPFGRFAPAEAVQIAFWVAGGTEKKVLMKPNSADPDGR